MIFYCLGLNHKTAPVSVRERFTVVSTREIEELKELMGLDGVLECLLLSTCNRMELYFSLADEVTAVAEIWQYLQEKFKVAPGLHKHFYEYFGLAAAQHLCEVAAGLNSMVLGETEIFGQVKKAYRVAHEAGVTGAVLNQVFQQVFSIGKKVRRSTGIGLGTTSVGSAAVDLAEKIFGKLDSCKVLILGAGKMSRITAQSLQLRGAKSIFVANRSHQRAAELAELMGGEAVHFDQWIERLVDVDIVISSTSAPHPVVHREHVAAIRSRRKYRPLFLIDIAVPRDIEPEVGEIDEVYLYDIDTLEQLAEEGRRNRQRQIQQCERIIEQELGERRLPGINDKQNEAYSDRNAGQ